MTIELFDTDANKFTPKVERIYHNYTLAALEDELVKTISSHNIIHIEEDDDGNEYIRIMHDYLEQAEWLLYRINVYQPILEFIIFEDDIPKRLVKALERQGKKGMYCIVTNAVRRVLESVNEEYFHTNGIYGKVKWRVATVK